MSPRLSARRKVLPIPMTIQRVNGVLSGAQKSNCESLPVLRENFHQLLGRNNFELAVGTIARPLIRSPSAKLGHMAESRTLHVLVSSLDYKCRPQRLPGKVRTLAPATCASRNALPRLAFLGICPVPPRVIQPSVFTIGLEVLDKFQALLIGEARAHAHVL